MIEIYTLFSGSSGNCVFVRDPSASILIDAGGSMKKIRTALDSLGVSLCDITDLFVTHEHSDHTAAIPMLLKHTNIRIHATTPTAQVMGVTPCQRLIAHQPVYEVSVGNIMIRSFLTPHDSIMSVGYTIEQGGEKYAVATDMGMVAQSVADTLRGCRAVIVEANYDPAMLKNGSYPPMLKRRIESKTGHLPNHECAKLVGFLAGQGTERFLLAHLSAENNTPKLALDTVKTHLTGLGLFPSVDVADRYAITRLI